MPPTPRATILGMYPWIKRIVTNSGDSDALVVYFNDGQKIIEIRPRLLWMPVIRTDKVPAPMRKNFVIRGIIAIALTLAAGGSAIVGTAVRGGFEWHLKVGQVNTVGRRAQATLRGAGGSEWSWLFSFGWSSYRLRIGYYEYLDGLAGAESTQKSLPGLRYIRVVSHDPRTDHGFRRYSLSISAEPILVLSVLCGVYPVFALLRGPVLRRRRRRKGLCTKCGYDMTGNTSGVCPECGTKVERP